MQHGAVTVVYDGDGNRVAETAGGVTTKYLVSDVNPTGYAQVVDELQAGAVVRRYSYGLEMISETQKIAGVFQTSFYSYDGHGSVRQLTNPAGTVTDTYTYDAFGNLIEQTGTTPNLYLYAGQQFDPDLGLYYNRARYLDVRNGRFWGMDSYDGDLQSPLSLHRYVYAAENPVDLLDPSGMEPDFGSADFGYEVENQVFPLYMAEHLGDFVLAGKWTKLGAAGELLYRLKPDILNFSARRWLEIKPLSFSGVSRATAAWGLYYAELSSADFYPDVKWFPKIPVQVYGQTVFVFNAAGILFYTKDRDKLRRATEVLEGVVSVAAAFILLNATNDLIGNTLIPALRGIGEVDLGGRFVVATQEEAMGG